MYLTNITIDILQEDKKLRTIRIFPKRAEEKVIIDYVENIAKDDNNKDVYSSIKLFNKADCKIISSELILNSISLTNDELKFKIEHKGIPIGEPSAYPTGLYNLILPKDFKLQEFKIVDPYDNKERDEDKKQFKKYEIYWDTQIACHLIKMNLHGRRNTFSLCTFGKANKNVDYSKILKVKTASNLISTIAPESILKKDFGRRVKNFFIKLSSYLEIKPSIGGVSINVNKIIDENLN